MTIQHAPITRCTEFSYALVANFSKDRLGSPEPVQGLRYRFDSGRGFFGFSRHRSYSRFAHRDYRQ